MHNPEHIISGIADNQPVATANGAAATITLPAPGERQRWLILSHSVSIGGTPTAAPIFTVVSGATTIERLDFPLAAVAPYSSRAALRGGVNEAITINLTSAGAGVQGTVSVRAVKAPASGV